MADCRQIDSPAADARWIAGGPAPLAKICRFEFKNHSVPCSSGAPHIRISTDISTVCSSAILRITEALKIQRRMLLRTQARRMVDVVFRPST